MKRHDARENVFLAFFEGSFVDFENFLHLGGVDLQESIYQLDDFSLKIIEQYLAHQDEIDQMIEARLTGWTTERLARVNLAILRVAVTEMYYVQPDMESVIINEAVELSKKYGDSDGYQFINGVLGSLVRNSGKLPDSALSSSVSADQSTSPDNEK